MSAPGLKLVYFAVRARTEAIRMSLAYGRIPYESLSCTDHFGKGWREARSEVPWGQLPILVVDDGAVIAQTAAIARYIGGLAGLVPGGAVEAALADSVWGASEELSSINPIVNVYRGDEFAAKKQDYFENVWPRRVANLDRALTSTEGAFFLGEEPNYADFGVYHVLSNALLVDPTALGPFPSLQAFLKAVEGLEGVREYLETRPTPVDIGVKPMLTGEPVGAGKL